MPSNSTIATGGTVWEQFAHRQNGQPFLESQVLYSLTPEIIDAIRDLIPDFFTIRQVYFERDLARTASFGFFHQSALDFTDLCQGADKETQADKQTRSADAIKEMLRDEYRISGVSDFDIDNSFQKATENDELISLRMRSFTGWLIANSQFRQEVQDLQEDWGATIDQIGEFPVTPRWPSHDQSEQWSSIASHECTAGVLAFYRRWGLDRLLTWQWPLPMEPDLIGGMLRNLEVHSEAGLTIVVPWYLLRDGKLNLQEIAQDKRMTAVPLHLREWVQKTGAKQAELGDHRYERLAWIYRFLILGLRQRYPEKCNRKTKKLDEALAQVLKLDEESIRKLRLELQRALTGAD